MSTILVDQFGRPLTADAVGPMFGPTRFEDQPAYVRRRGRKGKALSRRGSSRRGRKTSARRGSARKGRKSARARNRTDYRNFLSKRSTTYGPVAFSDQPTWVRKRGRKGKALRGRKSAARTTRRSARRSGARSAGSTREVRRLRREGAITRKQARKLNRQLARTKSKAGKRSKKSGMARRGRKGSRKLSRGSGASKVLTYSSLMGQLRKRKGLKAWVCVGRKRTGCGGGRKGYRGSRQLGVLRP